MSLLKCLWWLRMNINHDEIIDAEIELDIINHLCSHFNADFDLMDNIYNLFDIIGIKDVKLIHECMVSIFENKITPNTVAEFEEEEKKIIEKIRDASKIKLEKWVYNLLSDAYITYLAWHFTLSDSDEILSEEDMYFAIDEIDKIYGILGRIYSILASSSGCFKKIQSLGGQSRAKKYDEYKREIFNEWEKKPYYSYSKCAREFSEKFDLNPKTIESWLSKKYKKS